jgi:TolA-binding protein
VAALIDQNMIPVKVHIKEQPASFHRFEANWTPTMVVMDSEGHERYRFVGYLPPDEYQAQIMMGLGKTLFAHKKWNDAERWFRQIVDQFPNSEVAPEALYWVGVCRYKATNDHHKLEETARQFTQHYQQSSWAKRSSVWLPKAA